MKENRTELIKLLKYFIKENKMKQAAQCQTVCQLQDIATKDLLSDEERKKMKTYIGKKASTDFRPPDKFEISLAEDATQAATATDTSQQTQKRTIAQEIFDENNFDWTVHDQASKILVKPLRRQHLKGSPNMETFLVSSNKYQSLIHVKANDVQSFWLTALQHKDRIVLYYSEGYTTTTLNNKMIDEATANKIRDETYDLRHLDTNP